MMSDVVIAIFTTFVAGRSGFRLVTKFDSYHIYFYYD